MTPHEQGGDPLSESRSDPPRFVPPGAISTVEVLDSPFHVHFFDNDHPRFEHLCDRGERGIVVCAPMLAIHVIECREPLTITPSILCYDCGTHGFIREGRWVPA